MGNKTKTKISIQELKERSLRTLEARGYRRPKAKILEFKPRNK